MKIDMHIHTRYYSACSNIKPYSLIERACEVGLDGIVITEHNTFWSESEKKELRARSQGLRLFFGIEVNVMEGEHYLIYLKDFDEIPELYEYMNSGELFHKVHNMGGAIIAAHPFRFNSAFDKYFLQDFPIHGLEIMSTNINEQGMVRASELAEKNDLTQIAASDAHSLKSVGQYYTIFYDTIENESDLVKAIKNKRCKPFL